MKTVIAVIPLSWEFIPSYFLISWTNMLVYAQGKYNLSIIFDRTPYIDYGRDFLVSEALKMNPNYILFLDADQYYPAETPEILMRHVDTGKLIVAGVTPHRRTGQPMLYDFNGDAHNFHYHQKLPKKPKTIRVDGSGMGGVIIHPNVFKKFLKYPYFQMVWNDESNRKCGEDVAFFRRCKDAGIEVWCDTGLRYGHVVTGVRELKK